MPRLLLVILLCGLLAGTVSAQSSTGRHRRTPAAEPEPSTAAEDPVLKKWFFMPGAGLMTSGDLARFRTTNGGDQTWSPPGGREFSSADFVLTLDESIGLAVTVGRRLGSRLAVRLDLSAGQLPISALARVGETAEVHRWDELALVMVGLTGEYRLSNTPSHLYLLAGGGITQVAGSISDAYDQTQAAIRVGGGFHQHLGGDWGLRAEIRDTVQSLDFAGYQPPVPEGGTYPGVQVEELSPQHVVEVLLLLHGSL